MILRRVIEHVKAQNWTAVGIDFVIVVTGVFIGIQVSNWNDERQQRVLETAYLARLASDIKESIGAFSAENDSTIAGKETVSDFVSALNQAVTPDDELVDSAREFFTVGWPVPYFQPKRLAFDELASTGNLQIIRNVDLREAITELYAYYDRVEDSFQVNLEWLLPNDARITYEFDALRWDQRTSRLYAERPAGEAAKELRDHRAELTRIAVSSYWLKDRSLGYFDEAIAKSEVVKLHIESEITE